MSQGANIGSAYVQIIPSAQGISGSISRLMGGEAVSAGIATGRAFGNSMMTALKGVIVAAGVGKMLKSVIAAGGDLQQSFGGLDTIYEDAADAAKKLSKEAVKAGISSNKYAEQAVSFGAALKQSYGGDNLKAIEAANVAIIDMADNAAKMGTPIESIQQAYQSFARGQYVLLDNLKLGYGGTKGEMERLLADAEKLTGVKYDISNLGDVYKAIHVIQEDLHLTGVAAEEAEHTFTGSANAMRASMENLMANMALGESISEPLKVLGGSITAFFEGNLIPMIGNVFASLPELITSGLSPAINAAFSSLAEGLNITAENGEAIAKNAVVILTSITDGIAKNAPELLPAAVNVIISTFVGLLDNVDEVLTAGENLLSGLLDGMIGAEGVLVEKIPILLTKIGEAIILNAPKLFDLGGMMQGYFIQGMKDKIFEYIAGGGNIGDLVTPIISEIELHKEELITAGRSILAHLTGGLSENVFQLVEAGGMAIGMLKDALAAEIVSRIPAEGQEAIAKFVLGVKQKLADITAAARQIIENLTSGIRNGISVVLTAAGELVSKVKEKITGKEWIEAGKNIINGIIQGVKSMGDAFITAVISMCEGAFDAVKKFFKIGSPSKLMADKIGEMIPAGIAEGILDNENVVKNAMTDLESVTTMTVNPSYANNNSNAAVLARMDAMISLMSQYFPEMAESGEMSISTINRRLGAVLQ